MTDPRVHFTRYDARILRDCYTGLLRETILDLADRIERVADPESPTDHEGHCLYMRQYESDL